MNESMQKRTLGIVLLTLIVPGLALGWSWLSQTLQGIPAAVGAVAIVLVAAYLTYAGVRLVTEASTQSDQGEAEQERDSSL